MITKLCVGGEKLYKVIKTREKNHASGVYEKTITDEKYYENETVPYNFYTKN